MGNKQNKLDKGLLDFIESEFQRVKKSETRNYLILSEVLSLQHPEDYPFTFAHIGNLFVLDSDKDGRITLKEIEDFAEFCHQKLNCTKPYEFKSQLQASSTLALWNFLNSNQSAESDFISWLLRLLYSSYLCPSTLPQSCSTQFVSITAVPALFSIFNIQNLAGIDLQAFVNLLQICSEQNGSMDLNDERFDEVVSLDAIQMFAKLFFLNRKSKFIVCLDREFVGGLMKLMKEIGFDISF